MKKRVLSILMVAMMLLAMLPMTAFATEMSDEFKSILNENNELVINAVAPTTNEELDFYLMEYLWMQYWEIGDVYGESMTYDEETSTCDIYLNDECHNVKVVFNYDENVKKVADELVETLPDIEAEKYYFKVKDLELINYWLTRTGNEADEMGSGLDNYSSELKSFLGNRNFRFYVDNRAGDDSPFFTLRLGIALLMHDDITYYVEHALGTKAEHAIYVPDETGDSKEDLIAAVQERIDAYAGEGKVVVSFGGDSILEQLVEEYDVTIAEIEADIAEQEVVLARYDAQIENYKNQKQILTEENDALWEEYNANSETYTDEERNEMLSRIDNNNSQISVYEESINNLEIEKSNYKFMNYDNLVNQKQDYEGYKENTINSYENEGGNLYFLQSAAGDYWFKATIGEETYSFIVIKDTEKMITPTYESADINTNVSVSSTDSSIPLDTAVDVDKLTTGKEYENIIKLLNVEENETYDISLYSVTKGGNVTKLENGTFEVKIPVSDELVGKNLVAYYVDENDKVVEYEVTVKDGYAIFETDHFSIYTIAEGTIDKDVVSPEVEVVAPKDNAANTKIEEDAASVIEKIPFTAEEKALIDAGAEVIITLDVKDISETVSAEDKAKVETKVKEIKDQKIGMYLDINMFKQVGDNQAVKVPELNGKVKIQLTVPDELILKDAKKEREYSIIRIHDGKADIIEPEFDAETKYLTFETDHFSTYALVYKDVAKAPATGDSTPIGIWGILFVVGGAAILSGIRRKSYI